MRFPFNFGSPAFASFEESVLPASWVLQAGLLKPGCKKADLLIQKALEGRNSVPNGFYLIPVPQSRLMLARVKAPKHHVNTWILPNRISDIAFSLVLGTRV